MGYGPGASYPFYVVQTPVSDFGSQSRSVLPSQDVSLTGWGAVLDGRPAQGNWRGHLLDWHINCLEMMPLFRALKYFLQHLSGYHVLVRVDNTALVSYINHQGRLRSRCLNRLAQQVLLWAQGKFLSLRAIYIPEHMNVRANLLARQAVTHGEWKLHPEIVKSNLENILRSRDEPLYFTGDSTMSPLLLSNSSSSPGSGRHGPHVAQMGSLCISPDRSAPGSPGQGLSTGVLPLTDSAPLADQSMVLRSNSPPRWLAVGERSPLRRRGQYLIPGPSSGTFISGP